MKNIWSFLSVLALLIATPCYSQTSAPNSDFEVGNFTGWTGSNGVWGNNNLPSQAPKWLNNKITPGRQTIVSNLFYDRYTCGKLPSIPPDGGKSVARLGNNIKGAEIEQLRYTMKVDQSNALFIYKYAVVFEDPDHLPTEQPFFELSVKDLAGVMLDSVCGYNHVVSGITIGGFETCEVYRDARDSKKDTIIHWKPWTTVAMDLTKYIGQTIQLEFTNADCSKGGHWSYAYLEARTMQMGIVVKACKNDGIATLTAPDGFSSYLWSNGKSTKSITVTNPVEGQQLTCRMASSPECFIVLTAVIEVEDIDISPASVSVCKGDPVTLVAQRAVHYQWSNGLGTGPKKVLYPQADTKYTVTGTTENGCTDVDTARVTVFSIDKLTAAAQNPCEGNSFELSAAPSTFVSYNWQGPLDFVSTERTNTLNNAQLGMAGIYTVSAMDGNGCIANASVAVSVNDTPDMLARASTACAGGNIMLRAFPENMTSYKWTGPNAFASTSRTPSFANATVKLNGTYSVVGKNAVGCTDTAEVEITVNPVPVADFSFDTVCAGSEVHFTNLSQGASSYEWDFGNGVYSQNKIPQGVTYSGTFDYRPSLTVYSDQLCSSSTTKTYKPYSQPVALFHTAHACVGENYMLSDQSYIFGDNIISRSWNMGSFGTSTDKTPQIVLADTKFIPVSLTVNTAHCSAVMLDTIRPSEKPITMSIDTTGCSPLEIPFNSPSQSRVFYSWDFGDGNASYENRPSHIFFNESGLIKTFTVKQVVSNEFGCSDSALSSVKVMPGSTADFTITPPYLCSGQTAGFISTSTNADRIRWTFHDGTSTTEASPSRVYNNVTGKTDFFSIKLNTWSSFGCQDSMVRSVRVYPFPDKGIEQSLQQACSPAVVSFETQSQAAFYDWDFGDGTVDAGGSKIEHIFLNETPVSQAFTIKLKVSSNNNCSADFVAQVLIHPSPEALFAIDTVIGCSPFTAHITNTSTGAVSHQWLIDSVASANADEFDYRLENKTGTQRSVRIELEAKNAFGCSDNHALSVNVFPEVNASFTPSPAVGCSPLDVKFTNTTTGASTYYWSYGDATHSSNDNSAHTYVNASDTVQRLPVFVVGRSAYGCIDTSDTQLITVNPRPRAMFTADSISGCSPFNVALANTSKGAVKYAWDYGNGTTSANLVPIQYYTNLSGNNQIFDIRLLATNQYNCTDTALQPITVFPEPSPAFAAPAPGCSPLDVMFENKSKNADIYVWDFGDNKMATTDNARNTYINRSLNDTTFTINLRAITHLGCEATAQQQVTVYATPYPTFLPSGSAFTMPNSTVTFENRTVGDWDFSWDLGDGTLATSREPDAHTYNAAGEYAVILYASGEHCRDSAIHFIVINGAKIKADFDSTYVGCSPVEARFYNRSINAATYEWDLGDGTISTEENPVHTYTEPGTYMISLTVRNGELIDIARSQTVTVYKNAEAKFDIAPKTVAMPDAVINTYNKSINGEKFHWEFGGMAVSDQFQPQFKYEAEGQYDIRLMVESRDGCRDTMVLPAAVTVLQNCVIKFPNVFTPDAQTGGMYDPVAAETTNDIFHPLSLNIDEYKLQIFDRWGEIVFESFQVDKGWDGYYRDQLCKSDVYVWKCEATCIGGGTYRNLGNVTLLR